MPITHGLPRTMPLGECADLVRLVADDDRVPRVRAALVTADDIRVLREQVDDLALAFVSPLRADDDGRKHARSLGGALGYRSVGPLDAHRVPAPAEEGRMVAVELQPAPEGRARVPLGLVEVGAFMHSAVNEVAGRDLHHLFAQVIGCEVRALRSASGTRA